jgi:hypothetical protein
MFTWPVSCWASTGAWLWATLMFIEWSRCDSLSQCATFQSIGYSENVNIATDLLTPAESPTLWQMICIINRAKKSSFVWCSPLPFENHAHDLIASNERRGENKRRLGTLESTLSWHSHPSGDSRVPREISFWGNQFSFDWKFSGDDPF